MTKDSLPSPITCDTPRSLAKRPLCIRSGMSAKSVLRGIPLSALARKHGTPLYVYSRATLSDHFTKLDQAMAPVDRPICRHEVQFQPSRDPHARGPGSDSIR